MHQQTQLANLVMPDQSSGQEILRPYQEDAKPLLQQMYREGHRRVVYCAPTGSGKTVIARHLLKAASEKGSRCFFFTNRISLVVQTQKVLQKAGLIASVVWAGKPKEFYATNNLQIICSETLKRRVDDPAFMAQLGKADFIFCDEVHLTRSPTFYKMLEAVSKETTAIIGLTATPWVKGLHGFYSRAVSTVTPAELLEAGYLVPCRIVSGKKKIDTSQLPVNRMTGDYSEEATEAVVMQKELYADIVTTYKRWCDGKRAIVFAASLRHADVLQKEFILAGYTAAMVVAQTPPEQRETVFSACRRGEIQVLVSVDALSEGLDIVEIEAVLLCKPTLSVAKYIQRVGRGARPSPSTGKSYYWLLDFVGCVYQHGSPYDDRPYHLPDGKKPVNKKSSAEPAERKAWECSECCAINQHSDMTCHGCGALRPKPKDTGIEVEHSGMDEVGTQTSGATPGKKSDREIIAALPLERRQAIFSSLLSHIRFIGNADGAAYHAWTNFFGERPQGLKPLPGPYDPAVIPIIKEMERMRARYFRQQHAIRKAMAKREEREGV